MKLLLSKFYNFLIGMHQVRVAASLARMGKYAESKEVILAK